MNLTKLKKEVERLNSLKENRENCTIDSQLKTIAMVVDAVDEWMLFDHLNEDFGELWKEIKGLLNTNNTDSENKGGI